MKKSSNYIICVALCLISCVLETTTAVAQMDGKKIPIHASIIPDSRVVAEFDIKHPDLPEKALVVFSDSTSADIDVVWDKEPSFEARGRYEYMGTVVNTKLRVSFTIIESGGTIIVKKPNIYIYPKNTITIDVKLDFPKGGKVVVSEPAYNNGWTGIKVTPDGKINEQFGFLYYESSNSDFSQYTHGWIVKREELESFFRKNMSQYGFADREIEDFIEFWIPRFVDSQYFAIYPQHNEEIGKIIDLQISPKPESFQRLVYTVKKIENPNATIKAPTIKPFKRQGYTVMEWGVIYED